MDHPVKYLLFDFGGVLVDLDKERCIRSFAALGFDVKPYLGTYAQGGVFSQLESGRIDEAAFCQKLREASANPALSDEQACPPNASKPCCGRADTTASCC